MHVLSIVVLSKMAVNAVVVGIVCIVLGLMYRAQESFVHQSMRQKVSNETSRAIDHIRLNLR